MSFKEIFDMGQIEQAKQKKFDPKDWKENKTSLMIERAVLAIDSDCKDEIDDECLENIKWLLDKHITEMESEKEKCPVAEELKRTMKEQPFKDSMAQLRKDMYKFYGKWKMNLKRFYVEVQNSGIFPSYERVGELYGNELDTLLVYELEVSMVQMRVSLNKCKNGKPQNKRNCYTQAFNAFKTAAGKLYERAKKVKLYRPYLSYIVRAHYGLNQAPIKANDRQAALEEFVKQPDRYANFSFQDLFNSVAKGEQRSRDHGSMDAKRLRKIRKRLDQLHRAAIECTNTKKGQKLQKCLSALDKGWRAHYDNDMDKIERLPIGAAVARYVMVDIKRMMILNPSFNKLLKEFSETFLYRGNANFTAAAKSIDKALKRKRYGIYYDRCSLKSLENVLAFLKRKDNHQAILKCKAMAKGAARDKCFLKIIKIYRDFFDEIEDTLFTEYCQIMDYDKDIRNIVAGLRTDHKDDDSLPTKPKKDAKKSEASSESKDADVKVNGDKVVQGLIKLDAHLWPSKDNEDDEVDTRSRAQKRKDKKKQQAIDENKRKQKNKKKDDDDMDDDNEDGYEADDEHDDHKSKKSKKNGKSRKQVDDDDEDEDDDENEDGDEDEDEDEDEDDDEDDEQIAKHNRNKGKSENNGDKQKGGKQTAKQKKKNVKSKKHEDEDEDDEEEED